jgi:tripartite-type tricarboxylate transporter receptor subunit TctC
MFKSIPFEPEKLTPIVNLFHLIQVLVVNSDLGVKKVDELVAVSKAKPGTLNFLTASIPCVVYMDSLKRDKGADWIRVPFRGGGEAVTAILSGTTPIGLIGLGNVISQIKAGKMNALALVNNIRTPLLPDVPTLADLGYKGAPSETWYGLFAPPGTPKAIVDKLNAEIVKVVSDPVFREKYIISRGLVAATDTPEEFAKDVKTGRAGAEQVVKESGLPPQ